MCKQTPLSIRFPVSNDFFGYRRGDLHCEDVNLADVLREVATPFYLYAQAGVQAQARLFRDTLAGLEKTSLVCYAIKANGLIGLLRGIADAGLGADIVSRGELVRALRAGITPEKIVFSGVGKSRDELAQAMQAGIKQINIESPAELDDVIAVAAQGGYEDVPCALRVNTAIQAPTHRNIATAHSDDKFGIALADIESLARKIAGDERLAFKGLATHIGSNMTDLSGLENAFVTLRQLARTLEAQGLSVATLDLGGGLASRSGDEDKLLLAAYRDMVAKVFADYRGMLIFEPGRFIVARSGVLVAKVIRSKKADSITYLLIDAAMNDMMRPALYQASHPILPVRQGTKTYPYHVAGPICESTDVFFKGASLPRLERGDGVVITDVGAYGSVLAHQYNARPLIAELLVEGATYRVIKRAFPVEEALALEDES